MLRHDIMARYILSSGHLRGVRQVTIRLELARSRRAPTFHPRLACRPTVAPWERSSDGCASPPPPLVGGGAGFHARAKPAGNSGHAGHYRRVRESTGRRTDPELPGLLLSHHSRLPAVAAGAPRPLTGNGARILHGQYPGRTAP